MDYKYTGHKIITRVLAEKLWRTQDKDGNLLLEYAQRIADPERLVRIADEEIKKTKPDPPTDFTLFDETKLQSVIHEEVHSILSELTSAGRISPDVLHLTEKLTLPVDIHVSSDSKFSGAYNMDHGRDSSVFPENPDKHPHIVINPGIIRQWALRILTALPEKHRLTNDQVNVTAAATVGLHEWSHSLERAICINYLQTAKTVPEISGDTYERVIRKMGSAAVFNRAKTITAPVLDHLIDRYENDAFEMHIERFATAFEQMSLRHILGNMGLAPDEVRSFFILYGKKSRQKLEEFKLLREKSGLDDFGLWNLFFAVREVLKVRGVADFDYIESLWDELGYLAPYGETDLITIIGTSFDFSRNTDKIKTEVLEHAALLESV